MTSLDWIAKWANYTPESVALISHDTGETYTYMQLHIYALRLVEKFKQMKLQEGDRIAVIAEHNLSYIVLMSSCQRLGLILVPLNYKKTTLEIQSLLQDCSPSLIIYSENQKEQISTVEIGVTPQMTITQLKYIYQQKFTIQNETFHIKEDVPLFIFYTSGTTGQPKGVLYTNKMMFWNSLNTSMLLGINYNDSTLISTPPYHTSGWHIFLTPLLHKGGKIGMQQKFDATCVLDLISKHRISLYMALPTMLNMLQNAPSFPEADLSSLRYIISGGEAVSQQLVERFMEEKNIPVRQGYGLTEAGPGITSLHHHMIAKKPNSIGKPNFYLDFRIVTQNNRDARPFETGELYLHGDVVTPGYWNNSVETNKKIKNGWLQTGDLVYADSEGFLYIKGRKDDMYISGGENIYPKEVEHAIQSIPGVEKAVLLVVDNEKWGQIGIAFVQVNEAITADYIRLQLNQNLVSFKHPKYIFILKEIPLTSMGKVSRKKLMEFYNDLINSSIK